MGVEKYYGQTVTVPDYTYVGFNAFNTGVTTGFHYGSGGNNSWVDIHLVGGGTIHALDFLLGDGNGGPTTHLIWETFSGATSTGSGNLVLNKGTVGWTDVAGFTSLRVAALGGSINAFGDFQAIALDNLRIGAEVNSVPEPGTLALIGLSLIGVRLTRRKG